MNGFLNRLTSRKFIMAAVSVAVFYADGKVWPAAAVAGLYIVTEGAADTAGAIKNTPTTADQILEGLMTEAISKLPPGDITGIILKGINDPTATEGSATVSAAASVSVPVPD